MQLYRRCTGGNCTDSRVLLSSRILKIIVTKPKKFSLNLNFKPKYVQHSALNQTKTNNTSARPTVNPEPAAEQPTYGVKRLSGGGKV